MSDIEEIMADVLGEETGQVILDLTKNESLEDIVNDIEEEEEEKTEVDTIDLDDKNALSNRIVQNSLGVIDNAKMVFDNFSADVFHGADKSTSSKEALIKALDVQNAANKNMIDLAKVLSSKSDKGTNILINTVSEKQAGINLNNIKENL